MDSILWLCTTMEDTWQVPKDVGQWGYCKSCALIKAWRHFHAAPSLPEDTNWKFTLVPEFDSARCHIVSESRYHHYFKAIFGIFCLYKVLRELKCSIWIQKGISPTWSHSCAIRETITVDWMKTDVTLVATCIDSHWRTATIQEASSISKGRTTSHLLCTNTGVFGCTNNVWNLQDVGPVQCPLRDRRDHHVGIKRYHHKVYYCNLIAREIIL